MILCSLRTGYLRTVSVLFHFNRRAVPPHFFSRLPKSLPIMDLGAHTGELAHYTPVHVHSSLCT